MRCLMDSEKVPTASAAQLHVYAATNHSNPLSGRLLCLAQKCRPSPSRHKRARHDSSSIPHHLMGLVQERRNLERLTKPVSRVRSDYAEPTRERQTVGGPRTALAPRAAQPQGWQASRGRPSGIHRYSIQEASITLRIFEIPCPFYTRQRFLLA